MRALASVAAALSGQVRWARLGTSYRYDQLWRMGMLQGTLCPATQEFVVIATRTVRSCRL